MATRLTYQQVKAIKDAGRYSDGLVPGLTLLVKTSGRKSWVQRLMVVGKRRDLGLGSFPDVSLAAARERATENRSRVAEGQDPISGKGFFAPPRLQRGGGWTGPDLRGRSKGHSRAASRAGAHQQSQEHRQLAEQG